MNEGTALILGGCQTFTNTLPISKPSHLATPNTLKCCTPLASSKHKVIGLVISSNNNNGQSKHHCRVPPHPVLNFFFFFFWSWKILFTHLYFICFLFKFQSRFEFYNNTELAFEICCFGKENFRNQDRYCSVFGISWSLMYETVWKTFLDILPPKLSFMFMVLEPCQ